MANKNRNLILAFFATVQEADDAADQLKAWDHEQKNVKLGGMGIITYENGKLHTRKVGAHAQGTGAKWGTILGATGGLLAGIATGGIGLIPGAILGLGAGGLGGALFHKHVGLTDADKARLIGHLEDGGAAVAVMADDFEVEPTKAELFDHGGKVDHFTVPDDVLAALENSAEVIDNDSDDEVVARVTEADLAAEQEAKRTAASLGQEDLDQLKWSCVSALTSACRSLDMADATALNEAGVNSVTELLQRAATPLGRNELAEATGISSADILKWANDLDLSRVRGVGIVYANLLEAAGVNTVPELANRNPDNLMSTMVDVNEQYQIATRMPTPEEVASWVSQAKTLPRVITY